MQVPHIQLHPLPPQALLTTYATAGAYTDCVVTEIARTVSHAEFVEAFYTGGLSKVERFLLRVFIARTSTDLQARQLAAGELNEFAAGRKYPGSVVPPKAKLATKKSAVKKKAAK
jgi:hypothetical protein